MNRIDEIKEVHESVKRIKLMNSMSGVGIVVWAK